MDGNIGAKSAGMPLYKFLGGGRAEIGAYASSQMLEDAQAYAEEAAQFKADGWKGYKIHPPQNPHEDIKVCEAVRNAVGDDFTLMLDSTWSYRYPDAVRVGRAIERLDFLWYEDPLNEEDIYAYAKLKQKLDIPILATEYPSGDLGTYAVWLTERATDYLRGDIAVKGGLSTMLKTAHLAEAFHMNYEVHHGGNSLNNLAQLHLACAIRNTTYFEVLLPHGAHKYALLEDIEIGRDGLARCPQVPGIGAQIDLDLIKRKQTAHLALFVNPAPKSASRPTRAIRETEYGLLRSRSRAHAPTLDVEHANLGRCDVGRRCGTTRFYGRRSDRRNCRRRARCSAGLHLGRRPYAWRDDRDHIKGASQR
jgi:L-alanine-DL-glutamate epimerase-like enolase superfamily enzyme